MRLRRELEVKLRQGEFAEVLEAAEAKLTEGAVPPADAAWVCVFACRAAGALGAWGKAVGWAERGLSSEPCDDEATGWLEFLLGTALMYTGDALRSERMLRSFLARCKLVPALSRLEADGLYNLALTLQFQRRSADVADAFREAAARYAEQGRLSRALCCRVDLVWELANSGQLEAANVELTAIQAEIESDGDAETEGDLTLATALYCRATGIPGQSDELCRRLLATPGILPRQMADLYWIMGCNALDRGDTHAAEDCVSRAREEASRDWWPLQLDRIERLATALKARVTMGR